MGPLLQSKLHPANGLSKKKTGKFLEGQEGTIPPVCDLHISHMSKDEDKSLWNYASAFWSLAFSLI